MPLAAMLATLLLLGGLRRWVGICGTTARLRGGGKHGGESQRHRACEYSLHVSHLLLCRIRIKFHLLHLQNPPKWTPNPSPGEGMIQAVGSESASAV
jgi:hypothetical protein